MLAPLRLNSAAAILLVCTASCMASPDLDDPLRGFRTKETVHGLFEIREEAAKFLAGENAKAKTDWRPVGPDIRIQVSRCAAPLRARWKVIEKYKYVAVQCPQTISGSAKRSWELNVPVISEKELSPR